ncbi:MAG: Lipopolysaccharide export system ATP-binding protein LptB [Candidatus Moanabacter tarae]|uniref:Lipopolysaccharide export system ATP-binding protein LptB n=1 Tax=Candidatus Moanibacter tarae TaxID=2200854 RepID=A0A2Z4ADH1_9BACT|nr:MAG: Lipopolysaccharide export system ATP-binding protein LptB [Candidatus Moanabacter tarae]|tara:strand:+ start:20763 stop:21497 length:735 start_codon:yes stop_codon:yes gene_type:complete
MPDNIPSLSVQGIVKEFGRRRVVDGVDIELKSGEIVGLLGPNGAGKTTCFHIVVGLLPATEGLISIGSDDITRTPMYKRARLGVGYLPQETSVFRRLTVEENIRLVAETLVLTRDEIDQVVAHHLDELGLMTLADQKAYTLSGGECRRLEISRALVMSPRFLLMDEPFSGIDPISVSEVQELIVGLKEKDIGVLITDHNVRETLRIVDRAYLMHQGKVILEGSSERLLSDPLSREFYLGERFDF